MLSVPFLNSLQAWESWTPFPEGGLETYGSAEGVGAGVRWNDPQYGEGEAEITRSSLDEEISYLVRIEGGALTVQGRFLLAPIKEGTRLLWEEEGDFGWNPLMGYTARGMAASQGEAMKASLERLRAALLAVEPSATGRDP